MKIQMSLLMFVLLASSVRARLIDLSHNHGPDTLMPKPPSFSRKTIYSGDLIPGVYVEGGMYSTGEHGGTHIDAPVHVVKGGMQLHQIPLENTIAEGVMIDCSEEAKTKKGYQVPKQKLLDWEKEHGQIPREAAVIFNFGWSSRFSTPALYVGSDSNDPFQWVFPGISEEAGDWLYEERDTKIIASDTISPDSLNLNGKKVTSIPIHQKYLPKNRLIVENLNGTERLPPKGFRFYAPPVKFVGNTGAQVRAFAVTYDKDMSYGNGASKTGHNIFLHILCVMCCLTSLVPAQIYRI